MAVFTPTITGLTSLTTENVNIDNNSITALNSSIEQVSYTSASENLIARTEDFSSLNQWWGNVNVTVTTNQIAAPDGTTTADKWVPNNNAATVYSFNTVSYATFAANVTNSIPKTVTSSIFVKSAGLTAIRMDQYDATTGNSSSVFNLSNGTVTSDDTGTAAITAFDNDWYRIQQTHTFGSTSSAQVQFVRNTVTGNGTDGIYIWGTQIEEGSTASTYVSNTSQTTNKAYALSGVTRGTNGTTAATATLGTTVTAGGVSTTITSNIDATQTQIRIVDGSSLSASGSASIGTSNMDLNLSASGTGSVTINQIKTNSVTGEVIPGKIGGTNFTGSLIIGHSTTGTLNNATYNTAVGFGVLDAITSGDNNTSMGRQSMSAVQSGSQNTGVGVGSLASTTNGWYNTSIGVNSLSQVVSGQSNIGLGWSAGDNITSGDGNVIIGSINADSATGDKQLIIADGVDGSVAWLKGDSSGNLTTIGDVTLANNKKVIFGDAGEHIVGNGTNLTISSSGTATINSTGDIILDGSNQIKIESAGTEYLRLSKGGSSNFIRCMLQDIDLTFKGNDGGSDVTALTLDMSEAGRAIFNSSIAMGAGTISNHSTGDITGVGKIVFGSNNSNTNTRIFKNNNKLNIQEGSSGFTILDPSSNTTLDIDADQNISIPNGTLTVGDTVTAPNSNIIQWQSTIITANATVVANKGYFVNTTSNVVTITLPASAIVGDQIILNDYAGTWDNNVVTINRNGLKIQGGTDNLEYSTEFQSVHLVYSGATKGWIPLLNSDHLFNATGGTESAYSSGGNNYKVHTFTSSGTFTAEASGSVDYLVAAGGASGGAGGGGGAGGYLVASGFSVNKGNHTVVVGAGGTGSGSQNGSNGSNSSFSSITSTGGGAGGGDGQGGSSGGSGGGGGTTGGGTSSGGAGTAGQGNAGGNQTNVSSGGGGGGSGSVGSNSSGGTAGQGGTALSSSINGTSTARAGGGGGGNRSGQGVPASGGGGGAGNGTNVSGGTGGHATVNTGSGGGGGPGYSGYGTFGSGGSGIVIIRYKV